MAIRASGDAKTVARALGVSFSRYQIGHTPTGYVASAAPLVPRAVAADISSIVGLSNTIRLHTSLDIASSKGTRGERTATSAAAPAASTSCTTARAFAGNKFWTPDQISSLLRRQPSVCGRPDRQGEDDRAGRVRAERRDPDQELPHLLRAPQQRDGRAGQRRRAQRPRRHGGSRDRHSRSRDPGAGRGRSSRTKRPTAAPASTTVYSRIVSDDKAQVVSTSWGDCEADVASAGNFIDAMETVFQQAAAQGQSVFAASGDSGSEGCFDGTTSATSVSLGVDHPAGDPFVTAVGGTSIVKPGAEPVWNDCEGEAGVGCAQNGGGAAGSGLSRPLHAARPGSRSHRTRRARRVVKCPTSRRTRACTRPSTTTGGWRWAARASPRRRSRASPPTSPKGRRPAGSATSRPSWPRSPPSTCTAPRSPT